ncbi:hypothetical protein [Haloferula sargassicola]|uniref:ATP-binding protein n=1 Tax=Haloferula sargassicola TaxID=490096 RepID=A0ABP9UL23_9BACT
MTLVRDLLNVSPRFMRSVNLERDFADARSLEGYVTTTDAAAHLKLIADGLRKESGQRAWHITGDFGSGKSSFALVLATLMGRQASEVPDSLKELGSVLGLRPKAPRFLPVLVTGSREAMSLAVLRGLVSALESAIPAKKKSTVRNKASALLSKGGFQDRNVVGLVEQAAAELVNGGSHGGLLLIIDELGKFLEFAALNPDAQDVFFLQSLAEAASRSQAAPIHLVGLLHQGIAEYAEKLSITAQREWAKVGERFSQIHFAQRLNQDTALVSAAIGANPDAKELKGWKTAAKEAMASAIDLGMFGPAPGKTELGQLAPTLYPLHPTVIPVLSKFFRRFGQNERSLFSFLLSAEPFALKDFAERSASADSLFRLAEFYDFAAYNFSHRLSQNFKSHWNHIDAVVRGAAEEDDDTRRILKTVGILNVLQEPDLPPTLDIVSLALGHPSDLEKRLLRLCQRGILFNRGQLYGYSLWPHASVNLEQRFIAATETVAHGAPIASVVQDRLDARPVVARRHYIQTGNLRHFDVRFLTASEFAKANTELQASFPADGMIAVILCESAAERAEAEKAARRLNDDRRLLIAISPALESLASYSLNLERWHWVERSTPELKDDRFAAEEVDRQITAATQALEQRIQEYVGFRGTDPSSTGAGVAWYHQGKEAAPLKKREKSLQEYLSSLCDDLFHLAPQVRNELVNRNAISTAAARARQLLFEGMLKDAGHESLGLPEDRYPPEKSMYLSVLAAGGLHRERKGKWSIEFPPVDDDPLHLRPALDAVLAKLEEVPDRRVPVAELYEMLRSEPYGVRDGLIPILLLAVFIVHETEIAVYEDNVFQPEVEENLMMRFARRWETFEFQLCRIQGVRKTLISELAAVVEADRAESSQLLSIVRPLYLFVSGLQDYARQTDKLSPETLTLRKAIEAAREPADLVFHEIPKALGFDPKARGKLDAVALAKKLGESITELRRCFPELQGRMATAILESFRHEGPLDSWRQSIAESAETVAMGLGDPEFRAFCLKLTDAENPEAEWLEALGSLLTRCPPSRWKDRDEMVFCERIETFARQFERVLATCFLKDGSLPETAIRVAVTLRNGVEKDLVVSLTPEQSRDAERLLGKLKKLLPEDSETSLAVVARLLWNALPNADE